MTDGANNTTTAAAPEAAPVPKSKSGLIKYAIFGVAGLVLIVVIAFGTLMLVGTDSGVSPESAAADSTAVAGGQTENKAAAVENPDQSSGAAEPVEPVHDSSLAWIDSDQTVLNDIMNSLAALDYKPSDDEVAAENSVVDSADSMQAGNWLVKEKERLAAFEQELEAREKKLNALDAKLSQQILKIEQAESSRIIKLAKLYDGMEPRSVAQLAANLDDATVVALLPRMNVKNASQVMALMPPARAASLSKQMITIAEN